MKRILRQALCLDKTVVESIESEGDGVVVRVRPHERSRRRCPVCGRRCPGYDRGRGARRWRTVDLGSSRCFLEYAPVRVRCPEHGVRVESVPWADPGARFARALDDELAWLCTQATASAVSELMRVDWASVGPACSRAASRLDGPRSRLDGLARIGIDETSFRRGRRYMTVVVDHDRGRVAWVGRGCGKDVLGSFFDLLTDEQRASIEVVTADGAGWIAEVVAERLPWAERVMDPFHVVQWATAALDEVRRQAWRDARAAGDRAAAKAAKGSRYALLKNPENLTEGQAIALGAAVRADPRLRRCYLLKEGLRDVFRAGGGEEAAAALDAWLSRACRCRVPEFVGLSRAVRGRRAEIVRAVELGLSNARVEALNAKIKLAIRMARGFRNFDNLAALVLLRCSGSSPPLPGRDGTK